MLKWRAELNLQSMLQHCLFLHFVTANCIIFAGILETPRLLYSQDCLKTGDLRKCLYAKKKGVDEDKFFTVIQNYLSGKFRVKQLFKRSYCLWNKLGRGCRETVLVTPKSIHF